MTIIAEIATILSLFLARNLHLNSQKMLPESPAGGINPVLLAFIIVNIVMFVFLSVTIIRALFIHINGKQYQLNRKFDAFSKSTSTYLFNLKQRNQSNYDKLIEKTKKALRNLDDNTAFDEDIYYMLLYSLFFSASGNINVVSVLDDNEWVDTEEEDEFLRVNLAVTEKKIHLNRIFVVDEIEAGNKLNNKSIQSFMEADHAYIHLFVVFREKLSRSLINNIGSGFIEFYNFIVACDIFADNEIRGTLKTGTREVEYYNKIYMQLTEFYQPLNQEFKQRYFRTET
ncbi:MAG: hypothetical protein LBR10_08640 [Prevotellaceae bacterium]|nr:hypothetical protein [Prevotellaceae bacterium]